MIEDKRAGSGSLFPDRENIVAMVPELGMLAVDIVMWVDDNQPGIVACEFVDAEGQLHRLVEKLPMVGLDDLDANSAYPQQGGVRCTVLQRWEDERGRQLVRVNIDYPDQVMTTDELQEFVVQGTQVSWIPRGHREPNPQGALIWVNDE